MSRLIAAFSLLATALSHASSGTILDCKRTLHMLEPDVVIYTNEIKFKPSDSKNTYFEYIVAEDYRHNLVDLIMFDTRKMNEPHHAEKIESSQLYSKSLTTFNQTDYLWYRIDISGALRDSKDGTVHLTVKEYHKRRRIAFPDAVPLGSKQTMEFFDSKFLLTPYAVEKQQTLYMIEVNRIVLFKESDSVKQVKEGIRYGPFKNKEPFAWELVRLLFEYTEP